MGPVEDPPLAAVRPGTQECHERLDEGQAARGHADGRVGIGLDGLQVEGTDLELDEHDDQCGHDDDPDHDHAQLVDGEPQVLAKKLLAGEVGLAVPEAQCDRKVLA